MPALPELIPRLLPAAAARLFLPPCNGLSSNNTLGKQPKGPEGTEGGVDTVLTRHRIRLCSNCHSAPPCTHSDRFSRTCAYRIFSQGKKKIQIADKHPTPPLMQVRRDGAQGNSASGKTLCRWRLSPRLPVRADRRPGPPGSSGPSAKSRSVQIRRQDDDSLGRQEPASFDGPSRIVPRGNNS